MKTANDPEFLITSEYRKFIEELKARIAAARIMAARAVNHDLISLYWDIGQRIVEKQATLKWGESVVELIAADLQRAFPGTRGFSVQNLWRMKQFYLSHTAQEFLSHLVREIGRDDTRLTDSKKLSQTVRELVAQVPWGHHANVLTRVTDPAARLYCSITAYSRRL